MSTDILRRIRRWNFEPGESRVFVCRDEHEKGLPCQLEPMTPAEIVELIEDLRTAALTARRTIAGFADTPTTMTTSNEVLHWSRTQPLFPVVAPLVSVSNAI